MKLLAIDPSLRASGCCWVGNDGAPQTRILSAGTLNGVKRLSRLRAQVIELLQEVQPEVVVLEDYSYGSQGSSILQIAEWGGVLRLLLHDLKITVVLVPPSTLKMWATGKGNGKKEAVISELSQRASRIFPNSDEADAYGLCAMAYDFLGQPWFPMPKDRRKAFAKVQWPQVMLDALKGAA